MVTRLIGQRSAETLLARVVASNRAGHAYLFLGPRGAGKATAAKLFAQAVNCERQPAARAEGEGEARREWRLAPCGECQSCRRIAADTHPEVLEVRPGSKSGQDITIEQAREIRMNAALRPKLGQRRVYLFPNAEALNDSSSNALLKTLEEPSDSVMLILCAPSPDHVLPTIRSRCQTVRFGLADPAGVTDLLTAGGTTPEIARALARACGGRPGLAISWAQSPSVLKQRRAVLDLFSRAVAAQREARRDPSRGILSFRLGEELRGLADPDAEKSEGRGRPLKELHSENLETGLTYLRDLLLLTQDADPALAQNQDRISELAEQARYTDAERALLDVGAVQEAQQLLDRNVPPQLVLERMFWGLICGALPVGAPRQEAYA